MEISENLIEQIKEEAKNIKHGKIIIDINAENKHININIEKHERSNLNEYRKG